MIDSLIVEFDKSLRAIFSRAISQRPDPAGACAEGELSARERRHAAALMRVNHVGEVCAQALYQGQSISTGNREIRTALMQAAREETEHLAWTEARIAALGGRKSLLNPLWYGGALLIGIAAGRMGDGWNLGFLAETERQVEAHLNRHLAKLPEQDSKSRAVLRQMREDEISHAETAVRLGGRELPTPVRFAMKVASGVMTTTAYRI